MNEQTSTRNLVKKQPIVIMNAKRFTVTDVLEGTWLSERIRKVLDKKTGELKDVIDLIFVTDKSEKFAIPLDAGLRVALSEFDVKQGDYVQLTKMPQIDHNGNKINQYEVMVAQ